MSPTLLAFYAGLRSITTLHPQVLAAVGRSRDQMRYSILGLLVMPPLFFLGGKLGGPAGVAWAWIIGYPLIMIPPYRAVFQIADIRLSQYIAALWPAILCSLGMAAAVLGVTELLSSSLGSVERLIIESVAGAVTYSVLVIRLQKKRLQDLKSMLRQLKR